MEQKPAVIWDTLKKIALLGIERTPLPTETLERLKQLGINTEENSDTQILLEAAAYYAQLKKIDLPVQSFKGNLPPQARIAPYPIRYLSQNSLEDFKAILEKQELALTEFSLHAHSNQLFLPPEYLPIAFDFVRTNIKTWDSIALLVEENGWWLLNKNEYWKFLIQQSYKKPEIPLTRIRQATQGIKDFQTSLSSGRTYLDQSDWIRIKKWAFYADLNQYNALRNDWKEESIRHPLWNANLVQIFQILDFRKTMIKELQSSSNDLK